MINDNETEECLPQLNDSSGSAADHLSALPPRPGIGAVDDGDLSRVNPSANETAPALRAMSAPTRSAYLDTSAAAGLDRTEGNASSSNCSGLHRFMSLPPQLPGQRLSMSDVSCPAIARLKADEVEPGKFAQLAVEMLKGRLSELASLNLRDISDTCPQGIQRHRVFRSSQVFRSDDLRALNIISALDLREESAQCKNAASRTTATSMTYSPLVLLPDRLKLHVHRSLPTSCPLCSGEENSCLYHQALNVFHVDMLPPRMKLQIFVDMPWRIRLATCVAPLMGKSPQEVMTPAVADPTFLGYAKLYRMMLDLSMRPIARALRVFVQEENLPCVVHCIHGKDRTGLLVALLLLLLGVDEPAVVLDYTKSELEIKLARDKGAVNGVLEEWMVTDEVVASTAQTMEDTLRYLDAQYGGIKRYLHIIGISDAEVQQIRLNLLHEGDRCSLRNLGVLSTSPWGNAPTEQETCMHSAKYHLFRPHRDDAGYRNRTKHHKVQPQHGAASSIDSPHLDGRDL